MQRLIRLGFLWFLFPLHLAAATEARNHPGYLGLSLGYGSTTWYGLVPSLQNQNLALAISTPTAVDEGGAVLGVLAGYQLSPLFAIEATYQHFPTAKISFDPFSLFALEHQGRLFFYTRTDTVNLMAKLMLALPATQIKLVSSFGGAAVHHMDELKDQWRAAPSFGFGLHNQLTERVMADLGVNYTAGQGESELNPAHDYLPFLFSVGLTLSYRV